MSGVKTGVCGSGVKGPEQVERAAGVAHMLSGDRAEDEVLDDDGSPQKEAVPTPYRSEGSNPGPWRLILPPGRPSQRWFRCHLARRAWKSTAVTSSKSQVEEV